MNKGILILFVLAIFPFASLFAYDCEVDGIYYNRISTDELEVTKGTNKYTGDIVIPDRVTYREKDFKVIQISSNAFKDCTALTSVSLPEGISSLPAYAFEGCSSLSSIYIPQSVSSIGVGSFYSCRSLTTIDIPEGVTIVAQELFYGCSKLSTVSIPQGVTKIDEKAFMGCSSLTALSLPDEIVNIGQSAFQNCTALTSINLPNGITYIGYYAFSGCRNLTSITLPNELNGILPYAFQNCTNLVSVDLPDNLMTIGEGAFSGCTNLVSVDLPDHLKTIGEGAFSGCTNLAVVSMPESVFSIGESAYQGCTGLKKVIVNNMKQWCHINFVSANSNPLYYAKHLYSDEDTEIKTLILDDDIFYIKNYAFYNADNLSSIYVLANEPPTIDLFTFGNTIYTWTDLYVKEGLKEAYQNANYWSNFKYISEFSSIINDNGVSYSMISSTEMAVIPRTDGEKYTGDITIPDSISYLNRKFAVTSIGENAFLDCNALTSITIPEGVTRIGYSAFNGCTGLTSITIPNSVTSISSVAFSGCSGLTSVAIPNSVTSIGEYAFNGCSDLEEVKVMAETPPFAYDNTFSNYDIPLYVPESAVSIYQATSPWNKFKTFNTLSDIQNVTIDNDATAPIYDLNGKRLQKPAKGINIIGGKKILKH